MAKKKKAPVKHIGFRGAVNKVQSTEHVSKKSAERIIGAAKNNASSAAKKRNPRLKRMGGAKKK